MVSAQGLLDLPLWSSLVSLHGGVGFRLRVVVEVAQAVISASVTVLFDLGGLVAARPHLLQVGAHHGKTEAAVEGHVPKPRFLRLVKADVKAPRA